MTIATVPHYRWKRYAMFFRARFGFNKVLQPNTEYVYEFPLESVPFGAAYGHVVLMNAHLTEDGDPTVNQQISYGMVSPDGAVNVWDSDFISHRSADRTTPYFYTTFVVDKIQNKYDRVLIKIICSTSKPVVVDFIEHVWVPLGGGYPGYPKEWTGYVHPDPQEPEMCVIKGTTVKA